MDMKRKNQLELQTELDFLKGQIHPHFLFNTLNNLYALTLNQSAKSPLVVLGLSEILRYTLYECNAEKVLLSHDVDILKSYITLEKIRYEERLELNLSITGDMKDQLIAPLLMLPLVENAFRYGTSQIVQDAWINIDVNVSETRLKLKVSNSKPIKQTENNEIHFDKAGFENLRKRLESLYKDAHQFNFYDEGEIFVSILEINFNTKQTKQCL
jgi:LytS/YehU family sensor histidine kinase